MSRTDNAHLTADEDIIELTDIIEKGRSPKGAPGSDAASFEKELEDLFSDGGGLEALNGFDALDADVASSPSAVSPGLRASELGEDHTDMDADIDALLSSIGDLPDTPESASHTDAEETPRMAAKSVSSTPSAITGRPVDPDEELRMPDMTDVDALLGDLGAPAADLAADDPGVSLGDDDIDDLMARLDAKAPPAAPAAPQKTAAQADAADLDTLLDEILGPGSKSAAPAPQPDPASPPAAAKTPSGPPDVSGDAEMPKARAASGTGVAYAEQPETPTPTLTALAARVREERAAREALEARLSAVELLLTGEDDPSMPLLERVRAALANDMDARIESHLAPLRKRMEAVGAAGEFSSPPNGVTRADLDLLGNDLRATLRAEADKAAAAAAARILREEIAALTEAL